MAGLLDSKSRIIDAQLTSRGRSSIVNGGLEIRYVSFSDIGAKYENDGEGIAVVPLAIGMESFGTPNDEITLTTDAFGSLQGFYAGSISGSTYLRPDGSVVTGSIISGSLPPILNIIYSGSIEAFDNQRIISTRGFVFDDPGLSFSPSSAEFVLREPEAPPGVGEPPLVSDIDNVEAFFADRRFSRNPNFQYLPPLQRTITTIGNEVALGTYEVLGEDPLTDDEILATIEGNLQSATLTFSKYTSDHDVGIQVIESSSGGLAKLDIVRYGTLPPATVGGKQRQLYFVGKVFEDTAGNPRFVNIFDLVME
jgi:hypothetical protein